MEPVRADEHYVEADDKERNRVNDVDDSVRSRLVFHGHALREPVVGGWVLDLRKADAEEADQSNVIIWIEKNHRLT